MEHEKLRRRVLLAALPDVAFDGWSDALLDRAQAKLKISDSDMAAAFPRGARDLVRAFSDWADDEMLARFAKEKTAGLRMRDRIALAARLRFEVVAPYKEQARAALPHLGPRLPAKLWRTADRIWWACGDTATDYNHYTKRMLLSGVLAATGVFFFKDRSRGHAETWDFLGRRIDDVLKAGQFLSRFKQERRRA